MNQEDHYKELVQLDTERKWEYMRRYYQAARSFYHFQDEAVTDRDIEAAVGAFKSKPSPTVRKTIPLREWKFRHDPDDQGLKEAFFAQNTDDSVWEEVQIPHSTRYIPEKPVRYGADFYIPFHKSEPWTTIWYATTDNWYRKTLDLDPVTEDEIVYLKCESNNLISDVWVNDVPVMVQHLGLFPFGMDITEEVRNNPKRNTHLAIRVRNVVTNTPWLFYNGFQLSYYNPPQTSGKLGEDWYDQSWTGIAGAAVLEILNRNHIHEAFIITEDIVDRKATIRCKIDLRNTSWERFQGKVRVEISEWLPEESETKRQIAVEAEVLPMNDEKLNILFTLDDPRLWSPEQPNLYLAHIILEDSTGKAIDDLYETIGIRTIKIVGTNYYLNNRKMYPIGTHDVCHVWNESNICPSDRSIAKDILLHKKMGANCSRYPSDLRIHYRRIAEYCDQLGYMLSWCGYFEVWRVNPEMEMYATRDVGAMVRSLRNCPSIIIWEMGDEPLQSMKDYRRFQWFKQVYELVKAEDDTRPILPAGQFSVEILKLYEKMKSTGLSPDEIRKRILRDYPIYDLELTYWDIHHTIMGESGQPYRDYMNRVKEAFGGQKLSILTEFGFDALPDPAKVQDVYGGFHWGANPYWLRDRKKDDLSFYGKIIAQDDWRETQAAQCITLSSAITFLRENPDYFAGLYFMEMFDIWTYMQGVTDEKGNPKLGYFVAQSLCQPILLSGLHGSVIHVVGKPIEISASNIKEAKENTSLFVRLVDSSQAVVCERQFDHLDIDGDAHLTILGRIDTDRLNPGLYQAEMHLLDEQNTELARTLELFYLEAAPV